MPVKLPTQQGRKGVLPAALRLPLSSKSYTVCIESGIYPKVMVIIVISELSHSHNIESCHSCAVSNSSHRPRAPEFIVFDITWVQ